VSYGFHAWGSCTNILLSAFAGAEESEDHESEAHEKELELLADIRPDTPDPDAHEDMLEPDAHQSSGFEAGDDERARLQNRR
jgi:hypothetical protein